MSTRHRLEVGQRVEYQTNSGRRVGGVLAYGPGEFHVKPGENDWCGVILDEPIGKNNGVVQGRRYFTCEDNYGLFVKANLVRPESGLPTSSKRSTPGSTPKTMTPSSSQQQLAISNDQKISGQESRSIPTPSSELRVRKAAELITIQMKEQMEEKIRSEPQQVASPTTFGSVSNEEMNELREKVKDLESKLDTLRLRRAQDKERLKETERIKIQLEQLQENKRQMQEKIAELQKAKVQAEKEAREAREEQMRHAEETSELSETAELAILDKETAEERLEICQRDLQEANDKLEEARLELEILKEELEGKGTEGEEVVGGYQLKQLEQQNERLKDALLKLRDISAQDKSEINALQKEVEKIKNDVSELQKVKEKQQKEIEEFESQIIELKEQVDIALGSQEMVEKLTEKNLSLEDKVNELQEALDEEEDLRDSNNQILELKEEQVLELREELDMERSKISLLKQEMIGAQESIADYESTIQKFRDLVSALRQENNELQSKSDSSSFNELQEKQRQQENEEFKIRFYEGKAHSRAIDLELRRLELDQCNKQIAYLSKFMPEVFFSRGGDYETIQVLLLIPRMMKKCEILEKQIMEKYKMLEITEITRNFVNEMPDQLKQHFFARHFRFVLSSLQCVLGQYGECLKSCPLELFLKFGSLFLEMVVHERTLDSYIEMLKKDQLDETVSLEPLEKSLSYFHSLFNIHLADRRSQNHNLLLTDFITVMKNGCDAAQLDTIVFQHLVSQNFDSLDNIAVYLSDIQEFCKRIKRRLTGESKIKLDDLVENEIRDCNIQILRVINAIKSIRSNLSSKKGEITIKQLETVSQEVGGLKFIGDSLQGIMTICCQLSTGLQQGSYDSDSKKDLEIQSENPLDLRAQLLKAQTKEIDYLKSKLDTREVEVNELKRVLKAKIDEVSEMQIRRDLAEKKLMTANKDADDRVVKLQGELDKTREEVKEKEAQYEVTLNHYQNEIDQLVCEQRDMKEKVKILSKQHFMKNIVDSTHRTSLTIGDSNLLTLIKDLRAALKRQCSENYQLKLSLAERNINSKNLAKCKFKPTWMLRTQKDSKPNVQQEKLFSLIKQLNEIDHEIKMSLASVSIWDFKKPIKQQMVEEELKKIHLNEKYKKLEREIVKFIKESSEGTQIDAYFTNFIAPQISGACSETQPKLAATISMPSFSGVSSHSEIVSIQVTIDQLRQLHQKLL